MSKIFTTGISLNKEIAKKIDIQRGDVPRSKYICRILEIYLKNQEPVKNIEKMKSPDSKQVRKQNESDVGLVG